MKSVDNQLRKFRLASLLIFISMFILTSCVGGTQDAVATGIAQTLQISELETRAAPVPTTVEISVCPISDANNEVYINNAEGFCFQYPNNHTEVIDSASAFEISGPPPPENTDAFTTSFTIDIEPALAITTSQFAQSSIDSLTDAIISEGLVEFEIDGESAIWVVESIVGLGPSGARYGYIVHNGKGFILSLTPNGGNDYDIDIEAANVWGTIIKTWSWLKQ